MSAATIVISVALAAALTLSAVRKLSHAPEVVDSYARAGVPEDRLNLLALILVAGAAGLMAGLAWAPLGVAAASCLVLYFVVAVAFHIRAGDTRNMATPLAIALLAALTLALRLASA